MNPLERGRRLEEVWFQFSHNERQEFESRYGTWGSLDDNQRYTRLRAYVNSIKQQERETREDEAHRRRMEPIMRTLEGFAQLFDRHTQEMYRRLGGIEESIRTHGDDITRLETRLDEHRALPIATPTTMSQSPPFVVNMPLKMNCPYSKSGPKECIIVQQRADGTYGHCTVGEQANARQIAPFRWMSGSRAVTGCPSNSVIKVCEYLENEWVKI